MFEFLFNVSLRELLDAQLQFAWPLPELLLALLAGVCAALLCSGYLFARRERLLIALRAALAVIVVLIVARPQLLLPRPDSASGAIAVLVDDSASMSIKDSAAGVSRAQAVRRVLAARGEELQARFDVRYLRFDARLRHGLGADDARVDARSATTRVATAARRESGAEVNNEASTAQASAAAGTEVVNAERAVSDPLGALADLVEGDDIAAVVLFSDGGQVSGVDERLLLERLSASGVAVHVLGVGETQLAPDVGIHAVAVPSQVFNDDEVNVRVELLASGFPGQTLNLVVSDNGVLAGEQALVVDGASFRGSVRIPIQVHEPGLRRIEVRVQAPPADRVAANNSFTTLLNVRSQAVKVLHFEAQPRFEVKFLRRAVADDGALSLSSLVRTGDNRFLRLGISTQEELADGFPRTADELFRYQVLVIGSVSVATFTEQQLQLLQRFVSVRGGSVLFLGGRDAFAEGGWGTSTVAAMLPVVLEPMLPEPGREMFNVAARAIVTAAGREHAVTRDLFDGGAQQHTLTLPALAIVNPLRQVKRGASVLLQGDDGSALPLVMLAWQRFGAGRVAVLPARDTWRWRMHADVPVHDRTHELFWRRLLRWLARDVPSQVSVRTMPALAALGQAVRMEVTVRDEQWRLLDDAQAQVRIATPLGDIIERSLAGDENRPDTRLDGGRGVYSLRYRPTQTGLYEVHAHNGHDPVPTTDIALASDGAAGLLVSAAGEEFVSPALHEERLRRIAAASGGSYRHLSQSDDLLERIAGSVPSVQSWHRVALWNAPILLLSLLLLACSEWWLRRQRRQLP